MDRENVELVKEEPYFSKIKKKKSHFIKNEHIFQTARSFGEEGWFRRHAVGVHADWPKKAENVGSVFLFYATSIFFQ